MVSFKLSDIINIKSITNTKISLSKVLLLFYIGIACNFTGGLFSRKLRKHFDESRLAQHIVGFITMLVLIVMVGGVNETQPALTYTVIAYLWFLFTTKLDLFWNMIIICALVVGFLYESQIESKEIQLEEDQAIDDLTAYKLHTHHLEKKTYVGIAIGLITIVGTGLYAQRKNEQFGGGQFDPIKFLFY
ncbi:MAG: hypothetical protein CMF62_01980 [Magnetococcales bacterium]|nr:hypothetical protein [Magnetococcales bacterium]|tara:strand:+ start:131028 stop:131594 length:567 start_codon:yes stop_codon:yes gene_type:complete